MTNGVCISELLALFMDGTFDGFNEKFSAVCKTITFFFSFKTFEPFYIGCNIEFINKLKKGLLLRVL